MDKNPQTFAKGKLILALFLSLIIGIIILIVLFYPRPAPLPKQAEITSSVVTTLSSNSDPLGTVIVVSNVTCPASNVTGNCTRIIVSCPGIDNITAGVKKTKPLGTARGTVVFQLGGPGNKFYDSSSGGTAVVRGVILKNFTAVQISWNGTQGWLKGPGGPRKLACRFATTAQWIYDNIHVGNLTKPYCATGNSGGASLVAYSLSHYGLNSIFDMVEPTSGPPMGRVDHGCICTQPLMNTTCNLVLSECYAVNATNAIDWTYNNTWCSQAQATNDTAHQGTFYNDSVASLDANYAYPTTDVHVLFGALDNSSAPPQGLQWTNSITTQKSTLCVNNSPHDIFTTTQGQNQIINDINNFCKIT